jgi:hypothetical protein
MPVVEELKRILVSFPEATPDAAELARLRQFLTEMKDAGVAKTREYDLPQPDTIGRAAASAPRGHLTKRQG